MRHLLILASLAFGTGAMADEGDFDFNGLIAKKALRDYKKAVAKDEKATELKQKELDKEAANLAKTTRDAFAENLKKALKQSMQAGNLEEANKIDAAIRALKKGASPAGASVAGSKGKKKAKKSKARIPRDAVNYKGNYYKVYAEGVPHSVAQKQCEMMGGHLARIQNPGEQRLLARLIANGKRKGYWLDGSDAEKEGVWKFSNDFPMNYFAWAVGEPNNGYNCENRLELYQSGSWNDTLGGKRDRGFICEWDE
jgi:hypothetical protein